MPGSRTSHVPLPLQPSATSRALFFDAVGTLIHPDPPAPVVYTVIGSRFGSRLTAADIAPRFRAAFAREEAIDRAQGLRTNEEREVRRWRDIVATVFDDGTGLPGCFEARFAHFARPDA